MELINATRMTAGYTMGMKPSGREMIVAVVKGVFSIPDREDEGPRLLKKQLPLVDADTFTGEPGFSSIVYESDYAPIKGKCDVLLHGSAYSSRPVERTQVRLKLGAIDKSFDVVGEREWKSFLVGAAPGPAMPFTKMPISYDRAFGGIDDSDEKRPAGYVPNPAGIGYHRYRRVSEIAGRPAPNTEQTGDPVLTTTGNYRPLAFGPIGRSWPPRIKYAGTYDDAWLADVFPFLPSDFDERYYQCAPEDQQMSYPRGGELVELTNLTPGGKKRFHLPQTTVPIEFHRTGEKPTRIIPPLDTIYLEPDNQRMILLWRAALDLKKNMFEVPMGVVGTMPKGWYRARELGKTYYKSLKELVEEQSA